ncbi:MAG: hypothetical protein ACOC7S_02580 [Planctomycetota bacterium]
MRVALRQTSYEGEILKVQNGRALKLPIKAECYELVSEGPYTWAYWLGGRYPATPRFALFTTGDRRTYVTWPMSWEVRIADVSEPRDRLVAFSEAHGPEGTETFERVNIGEIVPGGKDWGRWVYADWVEVVSLEKDAEGRLLLTVKDTQSPAAAVLGQRNDEWVLVENYPDGLPEDRQPDD